jgi:hypothetical protein
VSHPGLHHTSDGIVNNISGNDSNDAGNPPYSDDTLGERKKKGKTVQHSKGGGDNNCGLDGPNYNETYSGDDSDDVLGGNRKKKEAKTLAVTTTLLARLVMVTMVMVTTVMALLTILVAMTTMMLLTHLTLVMLSAKSTVSVALVLLQDLSQKVPLEPLSAGFN